MIATSSRIIISLSTFLFAFSYFSFGQNCSVNAGVNQTICADQPLSLVGVKAGLTPNPTIWSQVSGTPASISTPAALNTNITGFGLGNYRFRISTTCQDGVTVFDDVDITVVSAINVNAGPDITKCKQAAPVGTVVTLAAQPVGPGETGAWTVQSGTSGTFSNVNSPTSTFTVTASNVCTATTTSNLKWTISNGLCTKSDNAIVTFIGGDPINAGPDQTVGCGATVTLAASCPGASPQAGQWTTVSGPTTPTFSNSASPTSTATNLIVGTYVLRWTVNGSCVSGSDDMVITVNPIPTPTISAGSNQTVTCSSSANLAGTAIVAPQQGVWSIVSGPGGGFFSNPNVSNPTISGLQLGTYVLQYQIYGPCYTATANVTLTVNSNVPATTASAGANLSYCQGSIPSPIGLNANVPNAGETGLWTQTGGTTVTINNPTSPNATVSGISAAGIYTFRWTISRGACTSNNNMNITITTAPTVSAGPDQTLACNVTTATLSGTPASGSWSFISGPATASVSGSNVTGMSIGGTYTFRYSLTTGCGTISDFVNIYVSIASPLANAGTDQSLACNVTNTFLAGNAPTLNAIGKWSLLSGPNIPTFANTSLNTTGLTGLIPGLYTFRWTISNGFLCPPSKDDVVIKVVSASPTASAAGSDITACYGSPVYLAGNIPANTETGTWTKISGPAGATLTNANNPTTSITGLVASSTYTFRWTISNACGSSFDDVEITTTNTQGPSTPNAGIDKCVAINSVTMTGNTPTVGTGLWSQISGPSATITTPSSPTTSISLTGGNGNYQFVWTISSGVCEPLEDTVNVTFGGAPTTANAGADQTICGFTATLAGNTPIVGTGLWTMNAGNGGAVITSPTSSTSTVTGLTPGLYNFVWTITNGTCGSSTDNVNIIISQPPSTADAGLDVAGCGSGPFSLAAIAPSIGTGAWSVVSGNATFSNVSSPTATVSPTTPVTTLRWTVTGGPGCAATTDDVVVTTVPTANAGSGQSVCNASVVNLNASNPGAGTGTWSQTAGPAGATISIPSSSATSVSGLVAPGTYTFRWDVTGSGCPATNASVTITNSAIPTTPNAGPDQTVCPAPTVASVTMAANAPVIGTGTWTKISGPTGTITTPSSPTTTITNMAAGSYKYRWTISNGACTSLIDDVDIFVPPVTIANAGADQTLCMYNTVVTLPGNSPTSGTGTWTRLSGPNTPTIVFPNIYNTQVTGLVPGTYNFQWQIVNATCSSTDVVAVTVQSSVPATPTTTSANITICSTPGTFNLTTVASAPSTTGGIMEWHVANSYTSPLVTSPTTAGAGTYYLFEKNTGGCYSSSAPLTVTTQDCGIYGNVYNDANGLTNSTVDGTPTNINGALYANLVSGGVVIGVTPILGNGTYGFPSVTGNSTYNVVLSIIYGTVGAPITALLPTNWVNTGENLGAGSGNDGTVNGIVSVSITTTNVFNANFGIEQRPIPTGITLPSVVNPTGTNQIAINPSNFTGTDGDNTITQVRYTTFPTGVTSITIGGVLYTSFPGGGITVPVGTSVSIDPVNGAGNATIPFTLIDNLGVESYAPANVIQPFTDLIISGTIYDDANGLNNNTVDGTTINNPSGTQLYANLVNASGNVVGVVPVAANGTYSIGTLNGVLANTNYTVVLSTTQGTIGNPVAAILPTNWVNTGENLGTGTGNDGTINGSLSVSVGTTNVVNANFGIEQLPNSNTPTTTTQSNPGGNTQVQALTLTGSDPEDGVLGTTNTVQITTLPTNATLYYNGVAVTAGQIITNYNPTLLTLDPTFLGAGTVTFDFAFVDAAGNPDPSPATATMTFTDLTLSGTVFDDANGLTNSTVDGTGTGLPSGTQLYANLVNGGLVVGSVPVNANGTYTLGNTNGVLANTAYNIVISTTQGTVGTAVSSVLPTNWVNTGENLGVAAGNDGTVNGSLSVNVGTTNIVNANFGIEQLPNSNTPTTTTQANPGGNTQVQAVTLTGSDPEDGALGTSNTVQITTLPTNATLYYNGIAVTAAQIITNYNPTLLTLDPTFLGAGTVTFDFAFIDAAGNPDPSPATATMIFTDLTLSGTVFDDANGLTNSTVDGIGTGLPSGTQLYANLVSGGLVVGSVPVDANGTYTITSANGLETNTNYDIVVSTTQGTVGAVVSSILPTNWVNTGENLGTGAGNDGTINGSLLVSVGTTNVVNANFGIEQLPNSNTPTTTTQANPGGTTQVQALTLTGSDPEDGALGTSNSVQITTLPTNATLYYNGIAVTAGQIISNYNPTLLTLDPTFLGAGTVTFDFAFIDAAGNPDPSPATATMEFTDLSLSGTVFDDANGLTNSTVDGTGTGLPSGTQLYANLVSGGLVVGSVPINANGTYTITSTNGLETNTNYDIIISTTQGTVGAGVTSILPTNWVNTGENLGTGAGNDGAVNGSLAVSVGTTNVVNANFAIEQLPNSNTPTTTTQANPGGNTQVQAVTLKGSDPEDGALGTSNSVQITTLPTNATLYYNGVAVTAGQIITNYNPTLLTLDPTFLGAGTVTFDFAFIDAAGNPDPSPATATMEFTDLSLSGTVFDDADGLTNNTVDGTSTGLPSGIQLYANLVSGGFVVGSVAVNANGTYTLTSANGLETNTNYDIIISTTQGTVGAAVTAILPTNWVNTGENLGITAGNDGTINGSLSVNVGTTNVVNANFGIEQLPNSNTPATTTQANPGGNTQVQAVTLTGSDPEDGALGTTNSVQITTLPTNATLYYNGIAVTAGQIITNYNPTLLTLDPTFLGAGTVTFDFAFIDAAGNPDPSPATATMEFTDLSLSGTVFDDADGLTNNTVDGTSTGLPSGTQLYANLVNGGLVVGSVPVNANGTYTITSANGLETNTNYDIIVSTTQGTVGAGVTSILPTNWVNTGENLGLGAGNDGTINGSLSVNVGTTNVVNANFGIEQLPNSNTPTTTTQANPGGTTQVQAVTLTGSDPEDGALGTSNTVQITTLPTNATLYYNGIAVTAAQIITNYNPTLLTLDPTFLGAGTVTFDFAFIDAAENPDPSPATATMEFTTLSLSGTVFDDANGLIDNSVNGVGTGLPSGTQLYANLVNGGLVVGSVPVDANGTYTITSANGLETNTNYDIIVSTTQGTVGAAVTSILPTNWVNTGENLGAAAGNDGTINGSLSVNVGTTNIVNANFGIEQLPNSNTPTTTTQANPGGTTQVQALTLTGSDPEDGALGTSNTVQITTLPTNATLYYNGIAVTAGQIITNYNPTLLTLDPTFLGAGTVTFDFAFIDAAGNPDPSPATATMIFTDLSLSGTVFDDANGLTNSTVDGTGTGLPSGTQLYANLVSGGLVVGSIPVDANGTYTITSANGLETNTNYDIVVSTTQGTVGAGVTSILPTNWVNTGENLGLGAGNDGTINGSLSVNVGTTNVVNANFGIEQLPNSNTPTTTTQANPGSNTQVQALTLTGSDPEDSALGTSNSVQITTLPTNATLYYNGVAATAGQVITNYNPTLLTLDPTFLGAGTVTFDFAFIDAAGNPDPSPATATMEFTDLTLSGTVFDDANGLTNSTVDGTGTGLPSGTQLYANLVSGGLVVGSVAVDANGTYTITSANGLETNTNYDIIVSTTQGTVGAGVTSILPTNWVNTGENLGTGAGNDSTINGSLSVNVGTTNVVNANFGIEQLPIPLDSTVASQINPGGTINVNVASTVFTTTDADGTVVSILITTFPSNVTTITIDGVVYNASNFPTLGVSIPVNASGNPTQTISIDPVDGAVTVTIPYIAIDNADLQSTIVGVISLPFTTYPNNTIAIDDDNNTFVNTAVSGNVLTNDFDPEGNTQTFAGFDNPATLGQDYSTSGTLTTIPGTDIEGNPVADAGDLVINPDGSYTFIPTTGFVGVILVNYQVCDNGTPQACDIATLRIDVAPMPDPIDVNNNDVIANNDENVSYGQPVSDNVLNNDNDPNGNNIIFGGFTNPNNGSIVTSGTINNVPGISFDGTPVANAGSLVVNADGSYTFIPTPGFNGTVQIPYSIRDDAATPATDNAVLTIIVLPDANGNLNNPPFAGDDFSVTLTGTPVSGTFIQNDNDPNGDAISVNGVTINTSLPATVIGTYPTTNGTITMYSDGTYLYRPNPGFVGTDQYVYQICDVTAINPQPLCTEATIYITISDVLQDFGDLPISFGIAKNLITSKIVNGIPTPVPTFWLGAQIDGEIETQGGVAANGDDNNNANGSTGDEDGLIIPDTVAAGHDFVFKVALNSMTPNLNVHYGLWIDWDNNGIFESFYKGSALTNGIANVEQMVSVPATYTGGSVSIRLRAFANAPTSADFQGTFHNGETEDFLKTMAIITFPVELTDLRARWSNNDGLVEWTTNIEINSKYFGIERSLDNGITFESIGNKLAAGNSNAPRNYQYRDTDAAFYKIDKLYYRLKSVDIDGQFTYSDKVALALSNDNAFYLNVYPNPTKDIVNIDFYIGEENTAELVVINALGQIIYSELIEQQGKEREIITFDFRDYALGAYLIQINGQKESITKKVVLQ